MKNIIMIGMTHFMNPAYGEVYSIQRYVIKFVRDLWQIDVFSGFLHHYKLTPTI